MTDLDQRLTDLQRVIDSAQAEVDLYERLLARPNNSRADKREFTATLDLFRKSLASATATYEREASRAMSDDINAIL
jgi:hypothetical protein